MLLPSAFSCDSSQPRLQASLFTPPSSPASTQSAIGNLINSCRNLHNLIASPNHHGHSQLPSPPLAHIASPLKPRLKRREAKTATTGLNQTELPRYRIKKRTAPPRGVNKRRRCLEDEGRREDTEHAFNPNLENVDNILDENDEKSANDVFIFKGAEAANEHRSPKAAPSTPKRQRIAPPEVPMGLTKEDFHKIGASPFGQPQQQHQRQQQQQQQQQSQQQHFASSSEGRNVEVTQFGDKWSVEDDSRLVEIVLEKVKNMDLSKEVWDDCVRNLPGKDYKSVSSRWNSLLKTERIGLQNRSATSRRSRLHGTW